MLHREEARRGGCRGRTPDSDLGKINPEFIPTLVDHPAAWLISRLPLSPVRAGLFAELAFVRRPA
jgi:hypothetical protein